MVEYLCTVAVALVHGLSGRTASYEMYNLFIYYEKYEHTSSEMVMSDMPHFKCATPSVYLDFELRMIICHSAVSTKGHCQEH